MHLQKNVTPLGGLCMSGGLGSKAKYKQWHKPLTRNELFIGLTDSRGQLQGSGKASTV